MTLYEPPAQIPHNRPPLLTECHRELVAMGGKIWGQQRTGYGYVLRCEIGRTQFRLILPPLTDFSEPVPREGNVLTHLVTGTSELRRWLAATIPILNLPSADKYDHLPFGLAPH